MGRIDRNFASEPARLLVIMPNWVGDVVMATPALRALRKQYANTHITLLIKRNAREVVEGGPWADEVIEWSPRRRGVGKLLEPMADAARLRRGKYDWVLLLVNSFRTGVVAKLAGIPRRIGYDRDGRGPLLTDRIKPLREGGRFAMVSAVHYYNELVKRLGCEEPGEAMELFTSPKDDAFVAERLARWGIADAHPLVVLNPGASFGISKLWIPERYAEVADRLVAEHGAKVVITFGPGEKELAYRIAKAMREKAYVADDPPGTLGQLKSLVARADLLLNNDTGPRHFAKAFNRCVVTVFGSTHVEWTHTDYARERIVRVDVDCGPCQKKVCPLEHHKCMTGVTSDMVYDAARMLLSGDFHTTPLPVTATGR
ncbi:MAG: lipopolysaccharide heptosyltransferase II [Phycisphaerales bacterium]|nr:lipopolysaccharide heptosyltransferase II [Phycisphaerales bacterium]